MSVIDRAKRSPEVLRAKRAKLFKAFDILKENVNFGIDTLTKERKTAILEWYNLALDLNYEALETYPEELEKYL